MVVTRRNMRTRTTNYVEFEVLEERTKPEVESKRY